MATVPAWPSLPVSHILTASDMAAIQSYVDFTRFSLGGLFMATQTVVQAVVSATITPITFTTELLDVDNGHNTVTNNSRYTAQTAGWYEVSGAVDFVNAATDYGAILRYNGATIIGYTRLPKTGTLDIYLPVGPVLVFMNVNDYVEVCGFQSVGSNLNTSISNGGSSLYVAYKRPA